ncbi:MAG: thiamine pyrophosphate-binding protein [Porticoccaceae bacterium]|nr:thiamine pyrophosphate-binding protein [Porticoccaceae bacterium]
MSKDPVTGKACEPQKKANQLSDLIVSYLERLGVDYVFGVPGGAIEPFVDALARSGRRGGPSCVMARHESGAAFMADGYYQSSGKLGVCFATTGPGATNLVTGVASAHANNIPLLIITAQTALDSFGRGALQESSCTGTNTLAIFQTITRYNSLVSHSSQLEHKLAAAIMTAFRSPMGPVHLSIPIDILKEFSDSQPQFYGLETLASEEKLLDTIAFDRFYTLLGSSKRPVLIVGGEASKAIAAILDTAETLNASVVATPHGKGLINPYHRLFRGVIGFAGHDTAINTLSDPNVDLVVAIGTSLGEWSSNGWDAETVLNKRLVHIASSVNHFFTSPMARLQLRGSIELIFAEVLNRLNTDHRDKKLPTSSVCDLYPEKLHFSLDDEDSYCSSKRPLLPQRLMAELPKLFPANTRYLADSGNSFAWAIHYLHPAPKQVGGGGDGHQGLFKASLDFASMGWAIASAIGTALALPECPVVCITGDGSYLMSGQEITVAILHQLPVIYLILNDSSYGMVRHGQRLTGAETFGFELPKINFAGIGEAMGIPGYIVESVEDLKALPIELIAGRKGPSILDVRIDPEAMPPIGLRTRVLRGSND